MQTAKKLQDNQFPVVLRITHKVDIRRLRNMERQADADALECLVLNEEDENDMYLKYLGAIIAHIASFYLLPDSDTRGGSHPDVDERLRRLIKKVDLHHDVHLIWLKLTVNGGLQVFMALTNVEYVPDDHHQAVYEEFEDPQNDLFAIIDDFKDKYNRIMPFTYSR